MTSAYLYNKVTGRWNRYSHYSLGAVRDSLILEQAPVMDQVLTFDCPWCGRPIPMGLKCPFHNNIQTWRDRKNMRNILYNRCRSCYVHMPLDYNHTYCPKCLPRENARRNAARKWQVSNGRCMQCRVKPAAPGKVYCRKCQVECRRRRDRWLKTPRGQYITSVRKANYMQELREGRRVTS